MTSPVPGIKYHIIALVIVAIWGVTFISTKILLMAGLSSESIYFYRALMAYIGLWMVCRNRLWCDNWRDEMKMLLLGITGGSLYFMAENVALEFTLASNVALLLSTAPLQTALMTHYFSHDAEKLNRRILVGLLLALLGVFMVVFNGNFILDMNPRGDILCFVAAMSWAIYTFILKGLAQKYPTEFITRKVFFYGLLTIAPIFIFRPLNLDATILMQGRVWGNLLFLGIIASLLCYLYWNRAVVHLGAVRATNYVYFAPPVTLVASHLILGEPITPIALAGAALILSGVYLSEKHFRNS